MRKVMNVLAMCNVTADGWCIIKRKVENVQEENG
jgi:hypothetical protein